MPYVNKLCLQSWRALNPDYRLIVIDNDNVDFYAPAYKPCLKRMEEERSISAKSDLLRLLLLQRHGGIWVDASLLAMVPLDFFLPEWLKQTGFFSYRFFPRMCHNALEGDRETVSWFLAVKTPNHPLIEAWLNQFLSYFLVGKRFPFFTIHQSLADLFDTNPMVRSAISEMEQISERIPHCLTNNQLKRVQDSNEATLVADQALTTLLQSPNRVRFCYSFMYKRPLYADILFQIALSWYVDFKENRAITPLAINSSTMFPFQQMLTPVIGADTEAFIAACRYGLCFFDSKLQALNICI